MQGRFLALVCAGLLAGCSSGSDAPAAARVQRLRPAGSPDVVVLSVSGHGGTISAVLCTSGSNRAYLGDPGDATEAVAAAFSGLGLSVQVAHFADLFDAPDLTDLDRLGFLQLLETMQTVFDNWIDGFDNPTHLVLVAHSHGATWAHIACAEMLHIPIEYVVTLDGICLQWPCEHDATIDGWVRRNSPFSFDISQPCDNWPVVGAGIQFNTKDIAFRNVRFNLEVQSTGLVSDPTDNRRLNGSTTGIHTMTFAEDHGRVHEATSNAMTWVMDMIMTLETS